MSDKARTVEEIEAEIQRTRLAMQSTVDELTHRLDPRAQVEDVKEKLKTQAADFQNLAKERAEQFKKLAEDTIDDARQGQPRAIATIAGIGAAAALLVGIALIRRK